MHPPRDLSRPSRGITNVVLMNGVLKNSAALLENLRRRANLLGSVREFFAQRNFWEVDTPLLSRDVCVDQWLDPFSVRVEKIEMYLQTSPEFAMKRLLCSGADNIFQLTRSFRQDEQGPLHNPEFTILEWYRCGDDHHAQMDFVESLIRFLHQQAIERGYPAKPIPDQPFKRLTYDAAFEEFTGRAVLNLSLSELQTLLSEHHGNPRSAGLDRDQLLNSLLAHMVEPRLKSLGAVFIYDYPASQAALARIRPADPPVAERFELYLHGIEICNGYHELTDSAELRERMHSQNEKRRTRGKPPLPINSHLLSAMTDGLPPCAGVALGVDRLIMHCLGEETIAEVIPFPFDSA